MPSPETDNIEESFSEIFSAYEQSHARTGQQIEATVVVVTADSVLFDIGYKTEGVLPLSALIEWCLSSLPLNFNRSLGKTSIAAKALPLARWQSRQ